MDGGATGKSETVKAKVAKAEQRREHLGLSHWGCAEIEEKRKKMKWKDEKEWQATEATYRGSIDALMVVRGRSLKNKQPSDKAQDVDKRKTRERKREILDVRCQRWEGPGERSDREGHSERENSKERKVCTTNLCTKPKTVTESKKKIIKTGGATLKRWKERRRKGSAEEWKKQKWPNKKHRLIKRREMEKSSRLDWRWTRTWVED